MDTFQFTFEGLAGLALGEEGRVCPCSVSSLAAALPYSNPEPDSFGLRWMQGTFIIFAMSAALTYPALLIILWSVLLSNKTQRHLFVAAQVMNAWSALDVFEVSIMAGVLEIERFAQFIVCTKCDGLESLLP